MKAPRPPAPGFNLAAPSFNFDSLIDGTRCKPFIFELDLSTARDYAAGTAAQIKITGNCLMIDAAPDVGQARVIFEGVQDDVAGQIVAPVWVRQGLVCRFPFFNLRIANHAQPGKKLRIIYGVDIEFQELGPAKVDAVEQGFDYSQTLVDVTALGADAVVTLIPAATNANGLILWRAGVYSAHAAGAYGALLANANVPASRTDGDTLWNHASGAVISVPELFIRPIRVRAGLGIHYWNSFQAETLVARNLVYTLL